MDFRFRGSDLIFDFFRINQPLIAYILEEHFSKVSLYERTFIRVPAAIYGECARFCGSGEASCGTNRIIFLSLMRG
jgi:hypothetical protein